MKSFISLILLVFSDMRAFSLKTPECQDIFAANFEMSHKGNLAPNGDNIMNIRVTKMCLMQEFHYGNGFSNPPLCVVLNAFH